MGSESREQVWVVPRAALFRGAPSVDGFEPGDRHGWLERIEAEGFFAPRDEVEDDPSLQQIIPYVVLVRGEEVFRMRRRRGGSEARLHDQGSIGVGGHLEPADRVEGRTIVRAGLERELHEEVRVPGELEPRMIGVVNDDSNPVGRVHFGVVHRIDLGPDVQVSVRETDRLEGRFVRAREELDAARLETWSRAVADALWPPREAPGAKGSSVRSPRYERG